MAFQVEAELPLGVACLKNIDTLLRCPICFDFLNISMMTKCSHNFCSLCIRKFLSYKLQCPVCNMKMTEQDLNNNRLLDDLVTNFRTARQQLSKANFDSPPISPKTPSSAVKCKTPPERGKKCNGVLSHFFQKKLKTPPSGNTGLDGSIAHSFQLGKMELPHYSKLPSEKTGVTVKVEALDVDEHAVQIAHSSSPPSDVKPIIKVECPVCSVSISQQFINKHLDTCLTRDEKKESLRSSLGKTMRPMGKLVYNLLSVQELKRKLKECHLSVQGSRDQLIKRHQAFVQSYNAECDSLNPKSAQDIAKEVEAVEKTRNQLQGKTKPVMAFSKNQSQKEIDETHSHYRKQHSSDFSRLIEQVRGRLESSKQTKQEVNPGAQSTQSAADQGTESNSTTMIKIEDGESDVEQCGSEPVQLPSSPSYSDVSISSSISDIFGPEPTLNSEDTEGSSVHKRVSRLRESDADSSSSMGKRRRKT